MGTSASKRLPPASPEDEQVDVEEARAPWSLVYSSHLSSWKYSAVLWGFDPRVDYVSNVKARLQPWCTRGRYFTVLGTPYFSLTISEGCFGQETQIRLPCAYRNRLLSDSEPSSHYLKPLQIVGYRDGIAIMQIVCNDSSMEFLVIHMKTGSVTGIHKEKISAKPYLCDCILSPDLSMFILKPNAMYVLNFCRGEYENVMKVVSCKTDNCPAVNTLFDGMSMRALIAFDPRYKNRRVAVGNILKAGQDIVCTFDLEDECILQESTDEIYQTTHNIVFSPNGIYLASLILGQSVKDGLFNFPNVIIYSSQDLAVLHVIELTRLAEVPTLSPAAIFPLFSETGTHLAVCYGEQGTFYQQVAGVNVYKVPTLLDLQNLCRLAIRQYYDRQDVEKLPLPSKLKAYLRFQPSFG